MTLDSLSSLLLNAPAWARIGLTVRDAQMRERAADALAVAILERLERPEPQTDRNQLALAL